MKVRRVSDRVWFTNPLCDLLVRKSIIHRVSWWLRWKCALGHDSIDSFS